MRSRGMMTALGFAVMSVVCGAADEPLRFAADRPVDCEHIRLELRVDLAGKAVTGTCRLEVAALREISSLTLDAVGLTTRTVTISADPEATFVNDGERLEISLTRPLPAGLKTSITVDYSVVNPASGLHFFGPSKNEPDVPYIVWSQGESTDNRHWFPCFDHPNERQTTEMIVTTDRVYQASSNGRLVARTEDAKGGTVTYHWLLDQPHAAYLVSLIVGEFAEEKDVWRGKEVVYWAHPRFKDDLRRTFKDTPRMLEFFSEKIGIDYPWDRYAQICCEGYGGGMENTSATTLGNRALLDERGALDGDPNGLIAHELAHQWWGDLLTCRDWAHIWLNEGFATYFEALWDEHDLGADEFAYNMYQKAGSAKRGGKEKAIVDRAYATPDAQFDSRAYPKGAWVLHMMRHRLGDELFWKVLNRYGTTYALQTVETVDLRKTAEAVTGRSFERFFHDWTERPGHPDVTVATKWLSDDKLVSVNVKQTQEAAAFHFPLTVEFRFEGEASPVRVTRDITEKEVRFYYPLSAAPKMVRVDPGHTVLMELKENKGNDLWKAQLFDDPDPVARIRAAKRHAEGKADGDRKVLSEALKKEKFWGVQRELAVSLGELGGDVSRDALIEGLTWENPRVRRACVEALGSFRDDSAAIEAVRPLVQKGDPSYRVEAAAIETFAKLRAPDALGALTEALTRDSRNEVLRSAALSGLGELRDAAVVPVLIEWSAETKPRQCRPAAIGALAKLTNRVFLNEALTQQIVETLSGQLDDSGRQVRSAAVAALRQIAEPGKARSALPDLERLAAHDSSGRVRTSAKETIKAIQSGKPAQVELAELRDGLKTLKEKNEDLLDRLQKLETRQSDPPAETPTQVSSAKDVKPGAESPAADQRPNP